MSSIIRQLQQQMAMQQEIARRLNRPIDLEQMAMDNEDYARSMIEQNENSLVPLDPQMIKELYGFMDEPMPADMAMDAMYRKGIQEKLKAAREGGGVASAPMIRSIMQLDR